MKKTRKITHPKRAKKFIKIPNKFSLCNLSPLKVRKFFGIAFQRVIKRKEAFFTFDKAFSRNGKITLERLLWAVMTMDNTTNDVFVTEFCDNSSLPEFTPTAFYYARQKVIPQIFLALAQEFYRLIRPYLPKGGKYRILAMDGSEFRFPFNPKDPEAAIKTKGGQCNGQIHLNALYDVRYGLYTAALLAKGTRKEEALSLITLLTNGALTNEDVVITDRLYCSFKVLAAFKENKGHFLTRSKDIASFNSIFKNVKLPEEDTFDTCICFHLSHRQTRKLQFDPYYKYVAKKSFPYYKDGEEVYELIVRVIRYKIGDEYYTIVTDIPKKDLSTEEAIKLYDQRWTIEVSFRELKKVCKLEYFHSKNSILNEQEIMARIAIYNATKAITLCMPPVMKRKHLHKVAFSSVYRSLVKFLAGKISEEKILKRMRQKTQPIRKKRAYPRRKAPKRVIPYNNR